MRSNGNGQSHDNDLVSDRLAQVEHSIETLANAVLAVRETFRDLQSAVLEHVEQDAVRDARLDHMQEEIDALGAAE